ncbi:MAG: hypothetical protein NVS4B3_15870 [Gemmatimonadaceae bacterium]
MESPVKATTLDRIAFRNGESPMNRALFVLVTLTLACQRERAADDRGPAAKDAALTPAAPMPLAPRAEFGRASGVGGAQSRPTSLAMTRSGADAPSESEVLSDMSQVKSPPVPTSSDPTATALLIRTGTAAIEVDAIGPGTESVQRLVRELGGYVANSSFQGGGQQVKSATFELKIPAGAFERAVSGMSRIGKVERVDVQTDDVSEEYVDVTARVTNARRLEARLIGLLATRTGKLQDVLAVERELARIREQIERYEGRLRFIKTRAAISTLTVTIHEPQPALGTVGRNPIADALERAWRNGVAVIVWLIEVVGGLVPILIIAAGAAAALWWWRRRRSAGA